MGVPTDQLVGNQYLDSQMGLLKPADFKGGKRARKSRSGKRSRKNYKKRRGGSASTVKHGGRKNKSGKRK
jgi:hypothetical protein